VHAVKEALRGGRKVDQVQIQEGGERHNEQIVQLCRKASVPVRFVPRAALDRLAGGAVHQGVVAVVSGQVYTDLDDVLAGLENPGLLVVLDGVEDPHNLGAIIRTAHAAGADAVIIPERRAAGLTPVASKAAAGALEYIPVCRVVNISRTLEQLKEKSYWIVGVDESGQNFRELDFKGGCVLVMGAEGHGLHQLVRQKCDFLAAIPAAGRIGTLNVSVAAGIVLFEALRQRSASGS
jgi:23S rRNA (guanosine2251-2'-O)-methyltransferase